MPRRIEGPWVVLDSIENPEGNRCVDLFSRPDGTFGFEEFRRDPEDAGAWTRVGFHSHARHVSKEAAFAEATVKIGWLRRAAPRS